MAVHAALHARLASINPSQYLILSICSLPAHPRWAPLQTVMRLVAAAGAGHQLSVIVASRNGVKINAVAAALRQALPDIKHSVIGRAPASTCW